MALSTASTAFVAAAPSAQLRASVLPATRIAAAPRSASAYNDGASPQTVALGAGVALGLGGAIMKKSLRTRVAARAAFSPEKATGAMLPLGYWDPCGLMKEREGKDGFRWKSEEAFDRYRTMELKHGRLAMLALTGLISESLTKFPMFQADMYKYEGWEVMGTPAASGLGLIFILAGYFELTQPKGDFKDPFAIGAYEGWGYTTEVQNKELAHGRMAMAAVLSLWLYDYGAHVGPSELVHHINGYLVAAFAGLFLIWTNPQQETAAKTVPVAIKGEAATKAVLEEKVAEKTTEKVAEVA